MEIKLEDDDYIIFLNDERNHDDESIDPLYRMFLEHLRGDEKSYVLEMTNGDRGFPAIVKYEREDILSEERELGAQISLGNRRCMRRSHPESEQAVGLSFVTSNKSECPLRDESCQTFLSHLKFRDSSMILEYNSVSVTYEEGKDFKDTSTASESMAPESTVYSDEQGLVQNKITQRSDFTVDEDDKSLLVSLDCCGLSEFQTKLMVTLNKPYDQNEYEQLFKEATDRKPVKRQKHLRSMSKFYATKEVGRSYLDHFPDLAIQFSSADRHRGLTLLRGFFFWLKNLCHEGAFKPWVSSNYRAKGKCRW